MTLQTPNWDSSLMFSRTYKANYLKFFERARTEWLRGLGFGQERLRTETGAIFVVADTSVRYLSPARLDDLIELTVLPVDLGRVSMTLQQQAWRHGAAPPQLLAEGSIRIGCVDAGTFTPRRIPNGILEKLR